MLMAESSNFSPENVDLLACCENIPLPQLILESCDSKLSILQVSRLAVPHYLKQRQKFECWRSHGCTAKTKVHSSCHTFQDPVSPWETNLAVFLTPCHLYSDSHFRYSIEKPTERKSLKSAPVWMHQHLTPPGVALSEPRSYSRALSAVRKMGFAMEGIKQITLFSAKKSHPLWHDHYLLGPCLGNRFLEDFGGEKKEGNRCWGVRRGSRHDHTVPVSMLYHLSAPLVSFIGKSAWTCGS